MISDEMRELLSAYVDGELRDADAVRVEEWTKRDPQLQRELNAYRLLRRKLKEWDEAENAGEPSASMEMRALLRVRNHLATQRRARGGALLSWTQRPALPAAALLAALGAALVAASLIESPAGTVLVTGVQPGGESLALQPFDSLPEPTPVVGDGADLTTVRSAPPDLEEFIEREALWHRSQPFVMGERAKRLLDEWEKERQRWTNPGETRSVTGFESAVLAIVGDYRAESAPYAGLVRLIAPARRSLPAVGAMPAGQRAASEGPVGAAMPNQLCISTEEVGRPVLVLAGSVWVGEKDSSGRTRIVTADAWIRDLEFVWSVWADNTPRPDEYHTNLTSQAYVLGPKARQRLLTASGRDAEFRQWLVREYKGRSLAEAFRFRPRARERAVEKLVAALAESPESTGFAVVSEGRVLGVELFANHELMMECAAPLLHGYAMEAGPETLEVASPEARARKLVEGAREMIEGLPGRVGRIEDDKRGTREEWPESLRRVNLRNRGGGLVGHGLLHDTRPVHFTLFGG
jgi:hypothetical protein